MLDRLLPGIIATLFIVTNAVAAPPDPAPSEVAAPNASVEIAPVEIVAAPASMLESSEVIDLAEQREIDDMAFDPGPEPMAESVSGPIADLAKYRRGRAIALTGVVGGPMMVIGLFVIFRDLLVCVPDTCPPTAIGPALIGTGATLSITLVAVGITLVRKSKAPQQARALTFPTPIVTRQGGGVAWGIRF